MGSPLHVRLLGRLEAARDDRFVDRIRFSTKKVAALLAFLAMRPQQAATREQLGTLLWGNSSDTQARQSLRQALLFLRKDVAPADILDTDAEVVRLKPGSVSVDALAFEALSASSELADLERAAGLVQGEFLAGLDIGEEPFEDWLRQQRRRFETAGTGALERYADACDLAGRGPQAIATVERLLALDPLREDWQRLALRIYARHRGHNEALVQAKAFEEILRRELGVGPEPRTQGLVAQISQAAAARPARAGTEEQLSAAGGPEPEQLGAGVTIPEQPNPSLGDRLPAGAPVPEPGAQLAALPEGRPRWSRLRPLLPRRAAAALAAAAGLPGMLLVLFVAREAFVLATKEQPPVPLPAPAASSRAWHAPHRGPSSGARATADLEKGLVAIAVLPFTSNADEAGSSEAIADLITDELTTVLSSVGSIRVISRETSKTLSGQKVDAVAVGAELGVSYLLEGTASMRGNRLRVNVGLVDAGTGLRVWSHRYERGGDDRHAIQDEIVNSVGRQLQVEVTRIEGERQATSPDVHALIAGGWTKLYASGTHGKDALQDAEKLFTEALEREPDNAVAQLGLAGYHVNMGAQLFTADAPAHLAKGEAMLQSLIERRPNMPGAHSHMGLAHFARSRLHEAKRSFERAIEVSPSHAPGYAQLGRILVRLRQPEQGLEHVLYALRLSPRDPHRSYWLSFAGLAELELEHHDRALAYLNQAIALNPTQPRIQLTLIATLALLGSMREAQRRLDGLQRQLPHFTREKLIERFSGPENTQYRKGLQLTLGQGREQTPAHERLGLSRAPKM